MNMLNRICAQAPNFASYEYVAQVPIDEWLVIVLWPGQGTVMPSNVLHSSPFLCDGWVPGVLTFDCLALIAYSNKWPHKWILFPILHRFYNQMTNFYWIRDLFFPILYLYMNYHWVYITVHYALWQTLLLLSVFLLYIDLISPNYRIVPPSRGTPFLKRD